MLIQYLSDLHLEFFGPEWRRFVELLPVSASTLLLAGDIAVGPAIPEALTAFAKRWRHVVYVTGNHELYGGRPDDMLRLWDAVDAPNVHWLENSATTIDDVRFVGATLWFPHPPAPAPYQQDIRTIINDFVKIKDFEPWVYRRNAESRRYLEATVRSGDVVVTHYLPHSACVHPKYRGSPLNPLFVCDMSETIDRAQPALWIHGHTHESVDIAFGKTRVVCNPYGYHEYELNVDWRGDAVVEVGT